MMQFLVFDASFTMRRLLPNPQQSRCIQLLQQWLAGGYTLCVPTLWAYEVTSSLNKLVHFNQIHVDEAQGALRLAQAMNLELVVPTADHMNLAFTWTRRLNRAAAYDSFYLALAESLQCDFWTTDHRLARAADQPWIKTIDV